MEKTPKCMTNKEKLSGWQIDSPPEINGLKNPALVGTISPSAEELGLSVHQVTLWQSNIKQAMDTTPLIIDDY